MFKRQWLFITPALLFAIAACNTTSVMEVPDIENTKQIRVTKPLDEQATFALSKVVANIKRGTTIAHFPSSGLSELGVKGSLCNAAYSGKATMDWGSGSAVLGNWRDELGEIFYETLTNKELNVAGDPRDLFEKEKAVTSAEYRIGAVITEIKGNLCHAHHWWDGRPLYEYSGEMFIDVEWTIYATLQKRRVLKIKTKGYYKQIDPRKDGVILLFHEVFARATESLTANKKFIAIATREQNPEDQKRRIGESIVFESPKERKSELKRDIQDLMPAVVTIRAGSAHGSGFSISRDGLILTNAHVVKDAKKVAVILSNGIEVFGEVQRFDRKRDVALVKVPLRIPGVLSLRMDPVKVLEKVYAIGSPLSETLKSTVTTGIVSALRKSKNSGLVHIQSDAAISPGNSGGPLLDEFGNVVGISVAAYVDPSAQNLNLFIPIADALETLNLKTVPPRKSPES